MGSGVEERHGEACWGLGREGRELTPIHSKGAGADHEQHAAAMCVGVVGTWCVEKPGRGLEKELVSAY